MLALRRAFGYCLLEGGIRSLGGTAVAQTGRALGLLLALEAGGYGFDQGAWYDDRFDLTLAGQQRIGEHDDEQQ